MASPVWAGIEAFGHGGFNITPPAHNGPAYEAPTGAKAVGKGAGKAGKADKTKAVAIKVPDNTVANRCRGFNGGTCGESTTKRICPRNAKLVHYCTNCGAKHPATECTQRPPKNKTKPWGDAAGTWNAKKKKWN